MSYMRTISSCFAHRLSGSKVAIADICDYYNKGMIITRINVPDEFRGQGVGSKLLKEICAEADLHKVCLWLEIAPSGGLDYDQLRAWYERYRFRDVGGIFKRLPQIN